MINHEDSKFYAKKDTCPLVLEMHVLLYFVAYTREDKSAVRTAIGFSLSDDSS